jgi:hypothetical protein
MANTNFILEGITRDCESSNAVIGVDKDLILIEYKYFDLKATKALSNRESDNTNNNYKGLKNIALKEGAILNVFEGTDYSVVPSITPEPREDGSMRYIHSIGFTVYSKTARDRETLLVLSKTRVVAVVKDRSTGLYELFGMEQGLKVTGLERAYVGTQNSNFYSVTISTPESYVIKESTIGELSVNLNNSIPEEPGEVLPPTEKLEEITDYNYNITRDLDIDTRAFYLSKEYVAGTTKVYLNGMRLTRGNYYDYREGTSNIIIMNYPLEEEDLLIVDYKSIII